MDNHFFEQPVLNSPYEYPGRHWELDDQGQPIARPRTLLIDSQQLESGEALDKNFRDMAGDEIERFRREIVQRTGDRRQADDLTDPDLLRETMNTVGKPGRLGESIRCVVSVSMLTEGWNANTVTHVLGVNNHGVYGRWAFAEFTDAYQMEADFDAKVEAAFNQIIKNILS